VALLTSLNHPNLVRFCGVCLDPPLVVMEYYRHGNVYSMLEKARRQWSNLTATTQHSRHATKVRGPACSTCTLNFADSFGSGVMLAAPWWT
jgi:hypothetical protein